MAHEHHTDHREADPRPLDGERPALGAVTQDDPHPQGWRTYPNPGREGSVTLVAVFEDISGATDCANDLEQRGLGIETALVARRGDGPEQGLRPGNVITGPGYGLSAHEPVAPPHNENTMGTGVAVGATLGATAGLLAATYVIPGLGTLVATGTLVSTLAGAGLGSFLGGIAEFSLQDEADEADLYAGQVRRGGVLLLVRTGGVETDEVRKLIEVWQPLEIRVQ